MGPKRGSGAAKMSQRGTGRGQVAERPRSSTPPSAEDEAMLVSEPEQPQRHPAGGDLADITAAARKKRKNKPYYYTTLTEAQKEEVIDWLKDNPSIYAKRLTDYKDSQKKEKLWEDKAADMGVEVADLKTFYKSNRTKMSRVKRTTVEDLSATDNWVWEKFFIKDHIETVERRNGGEHQQQPQLLGQQYPHQQKTSSSQTLGQSPSLQSSPLGDSTESGDLKRSLIEFMSGKKGGPSTFARHIDEGLAQLPGDIKRATESKLMEVLHEGQRQAEERQEMLQQMPIFPQQQQQQFAPMQPIQPQRQSYLPSSTSRQYSPRMVSQSHQWQPPPSQWSTQQMQGQQRTSVWGSQDCHYMSRQYPALYPQPPSQPSVISTNILDLDMGATITSTPIARASTSSQGSTAAAADKTTDSLNLSDFVRTAMTTAGITTRPPSPVTPLGTPQPPPKDDTTNM
ncbi:hypothetical protein ACOMHN_016682 [Nucella lapillus]